MAQLLLLYYNLICLLQASIPTLLYSFFSIKISFFNIKKKFFKENHIIYYQNKKIPIFYLEKLSGILKKLVLLAIIKFSKVDITY